MRVLYKIGSWIFTIGVAFIIALLVGVFLFQPYKVDGHSMDPTLHDTERIYVSKLPHTFAYLPSYGDIVVIDSRVNRARTFMDNFKESPLVQFFSGRGDDRIFYVKRVIGRPGDVIEVKNQQVYRNGAPLQEPYIKEKMNPGPDQKWQVPANDIFVMGDNRNNSEDSRMIGFIPLDHVMGKRIF